MTDSMGDRYSVSDNVHYGKHELERMERAMAALEARIARIEQVIQQMTQQEGEG